MVAGGIDKAGVSRVMSLLSKEWSKEHKVSLALFREYNAETALPISANIILNGIPFNGLIFFQVLYLYRLLKKEQFDRIYAFSENSNYPLILAAKLAGLTEKIILTSHNSIGKLSNRVKKRISTHYNFARRVITVSNGLRNSFIQLGVNESNVVFCPNPVDIEFITTEAAKKCVCSTDSGKINICAMGRLHGHKGFDLLIEALQIVKQKFANVHLHILGEGPEQDNLLNLITEKSLEESVSLHGNIGSPFSLLKKMDIFVLSSRAEGWPLALMEAMALKLPVVAFACPTGPDEIIEHEVNGLLVECQNVEQLAVNIVRVITDKPLSEQMAVNAGKSMEAYSLEKMGKKWLEV